MINGSKTHRGSKSFSSCIYMFGRHAPVKNIYTLYSTSEMQLEFIYINLSQSPVATRPRNDPVCGYILYIVRVLIRARPCVAAFLPGRSECGEYI